MIIRYPKKVDSGNTEKVKDSEEIRETRGKEDSCRCKEASEMTARELISLMISDLAFWKKTKKG